MSVIYICIYVLIIYFPIKITDKSSWMIWWWWRWLCSTYDKIEEEEKTTLELCVGGCQHCSKSTWAHWRFLIKAQQWWPYNTPLCLKSTQYVMTMMMMMMLVSEEYTTPDPLLSSSQPNTTQLNPIWSKLDSVTVSLFVQSKYAPFPISFLLILSSRSNSLLGRRLIY